MLGLYKSKLKDRIELTEIERQVKAVMYVKEKRKITYEIKNA
jgi:hypothetical protein